MDYDRIIIEMLSRIQALEDKVDFQVKDLDVGFVNKEKEADTTTASSKKYRMISDFLYNCENDIVKLTFGDMEKMLGFTLPKSAYSHRAFWANTKTHSIALSWLSVGFKTVDVSIDEHYVVFERERNYKKTVDVGKNTVDELLFKIGDKRVSDLTNNTQEEDKM